MNIAGIVFTALGALIIFLITKEKYGYGFVALLGCILIGLGSIWITRYNYDKHPTALDVYQDKTTIKITYKDGIPVDSIVVFK